MQNYFHSLYVRLVWCDRYQVNFTSPSLNSLSCMQLSIILIILIKIVVWEQEVIYGMFSS